MYHNFMPNQSPNYSKLCRKLAQILKYYNRIKFLSQPRYPQLIETFSNSQDEEYFTKIRVQEYIMNEQHDCVLLMLSNEKLLRYDLKEEFFQELEGLDDINLQSIKILDIGKQEWYVGQGRKGICIFSLMKKRQNKYDQLQSSQQQHSQIYTQRMLSQQEQKSYQINKDNEIKVDQNEKDLEYISYDWSQVPKIGRLRCRVFYENLNTILEKGKQTEEKLPPEGDKSTKTDDRFKCIKTFIIKGINAQNYVNHMNHKSNEKEEYQQQSSQNILIEESIQDKEMTTQDKGMTSYSISKKNSSQRAYLVISFNVNWSKYKHIAIYQLAIVTIVDSKKNNNIEEVPTVEKQSTEAAKQCLLSSGSNQRLIITPVLFQITLGHQNKKTSQYFIETAMCFFQVPFDPQKQSLNINPLEITLSNSKFSKTNPITQSDLLFVQSSMLDCFSLYYITQAVTHEMEQQQHRHYIFEFRFAINRNLHTSISIQELWTSPIYHYPERSVLCPAKVYCLPRIPSTGILRYINVTKNIQFLNNRNQIKTKSYKDQWQVSSYVFTTVSMLQQNKIEFTQTQLKFKNDEDNMHNKSQQQHKNKYRHMINEENINWQVMVNQSIILSQIVLLDIVKRYCIMQISQQKVHIRKDLIPKNCTQSNKQFEKEEDSHKLSQKKIVILNLGSPLSLHKSKRVSSQYMLQQSEESIGLRNSHIVILNKKQLLQQNYNNLFYQILSIESNLSVINNSLHSSKKLCMFRSNSKMSSDLIIQQLNLIPKSALYCDIIEKILQTNTNKQNQQNNMQQKIKQEQYEMKEQIINKHVQVTSHSNGEVMNISEMESLLSCVLQLLSP